MARRLWKHGGAAAEQCDCGAWILRKTYPGSLDRHGPSWRWRVSVDGERHTYMKDGDLDREQVEDWIRDKYKELKERAKRERVGVPTRLSVSKLFDRFEREHLPPKAPRRRSPTRAP